MRFNVHGGHSLRCRGASGLLDETNEDRKVKNALISLLRSQGHTVYDCTDDVGSTQKQNLHNIVNKCNAHKVDLDISIHLNAGGGHGCEVYGYSNKMSGVGARVSANIASALGITNRGFKVRTNLYVLHKTNSPAILVECCFVDSATDKAHWNVDKCARAIAEGVTGKAITESAKPAPAPAPAPKPSTSSSNKISVDGVWGKGTNRRLQQWLGMRTVDGIISNQPVSAKKVLISIDPKGWEFETGGKGSPTISALQKRLGIGADGKLGPNTIKAIQRWVGATADGVAGPKTVRALQNKLNSL